MRDKLREFLFPGLVLSIVASLWAVGHARALEDDVTRGCPPQPEMARLAHRLEVEQPCPDTSACPDTPSPSAAVDYAH